MGKTAIIIVIFTLLAIFAIADLDTSDIDALPDCDTTNATLKRNSTHWYCDTTHYGELTGRDIANITFAADSVYYNITGLNLNHSQGITAASSVINITKTAMYAVAGQISFSGGANTEYHIALGVNGERNDHCHAERKIGTGGDIGSASIVCTEPLTADDKITFMIELFEDDTGQPTTREDLEKKKTDELVELMEAMIDEAEKNL